MGHTDLKIYLVNGATMSKREKSEGKKTNERKNKS